MKLFDPAPIVGIVSMFGMPLRSEISPYGAVGSPNVDEVDADVAGYPVVVPVQEAETHVEHRARVDRVSISGHHLRRDEVLRSASPLAVAVEVDRQVVGLESCVASDETLFWLRL